MRFLEVNGFTIKRNKNRAFQEWLIANQDRLARSYPEGTSLVGYFAAVFSSEKQAGDIFSIEQLDSYAAKDRLAAAGRDRESEYARLSEELIQFVDPNPSAAYSQILLKDIVDATVFDFEADEAEKREPVAAKG